MNKIKPLFKRGGSKALNRAMEKPFPADSAVSNGLTVDSARCIKGFRIVVILTRVMQIQYTNIVYKQACMSCKDESNDRDYTCFIMRLCKIPAREAFADFSLRLTHGALNLSCPHAQATPAKA